MFGISARMESGIMLRRRFEPRKVSWCVNTHNDSSVRVRCLRTNTARGARLEFSAYADLFAFPSRAARNLPDHFPLDYMLLFGQRLLPMHQDGFLD